MKSRIKYIPLALLMVAVSTLWIWADIPPESMATTQVQVIDSHNHYVPGVAIYWAAQPMTSTEHPHSGTGPIMRLTNPQIDYSYTNSAGIATMTWYVTEYSGHYPWTARCPSCINWGSDGIVYVSDSYFGTQLPQGGSGFGTQYDGGHPNLDFAVSSFMDSKAQTIGQLYQASTLSQDGTGKVLIYTRTGLPRRGTLDNNFGSYFEVNANPDPHLDLREVMDIVYPSTTKDTGILTNILNNVRTTSGSLGWSHYGVGYNLQGQNILHTDGT